MAACGQHHGEASVPVVVHGVADIYFCPLKDPTPEWVDAPGKTCGPVEIRTHTGAGLLARFETLQGTCTRAVCEELEPVGGTAHRSRGKM